MHVQLRNIDAGNAPAGLDGPSWLTYLSNIDGQRIGLGWSTEFFVLEN